MKKPVKVSLKSSQNYYFCKCGKSKDEVLCDGSHKGSGIGPQVFSVQKDGDYYLCSCKKSEELPFCDGSHKYIR